MKLGSDNQSEWHFNLKISHDVIYISKNGKGGEVGKYFKFPTIGNKQNKLWHGFGKECFVIIWSNILEAYLKAKWPQFII